MLSLVAKLSHRDHDGLLDTEVLAGHFNLAVVDDVTGGPFAPRDHNLVGQVLTEVHCGREVVSAPQGRRKRDLA